MRITTEAIVLGLHQRTDKLSVLQVYTEQEGMLQLQVYGAKGKKKTQAAYMPLAVVEVTYDLPPNRPIGVTSSIEIIYLPEQIYADVRRQAVAFFVAEMITLTLTHPMQDKQTYDYLRSFILMLNDSPEPENTHLLFLVRMAELLGIGTPSMFEHYADDTQAFLPLSRAQRQEQLRALCDWYHTHIETFRIPKSLDVLIEVFD